MLLGNINTGLNISYIYYVKMCILFYWNPPVLYNDSCVDQIYKRFSATNFRHFKREYIKTIMMDSRLSSDMGKMLSKLKEDMERVCRIYGDGSFFAPSPISFEAELIELSVSSL